MRKTLPNWLAVVAAMTACIGDDPLLSRKQTSEHFELRFAPGDEHVCEGAIEQLESHYRLLHEVMGISSSDERIGYFKYPSPEQATEECQLRSGCAKGRVVHSYEPFHQHELIHAYLYDAVSVFDSANARLPSLLNEGAAVALACEDSRRPIDASMIAEFRSKSANEMLDLVAGFDGDLYIYAAGSLLVKRLIEEHGLAYTAEFIVDSANINVAAGFESAFGVEMEELYRAVVTGPLPAALPCLPVYECATAQSLELGEPSEFGARCDGHQPLRSFSLDAPGAVQLEVQGFLELMSCQDFSPPVVVQNSDPVRVQLDEGDYVVRASADASVLIDPAPDLPLSKSCADAESRAFASSSIGSYMRFAIPSDPTEELYFAVDGAKTRLLVQDMAVQACTSCAEIPAGCVAVDGSGGVASYDGEGAYVVVVQPDSQTSAVRYLSVGARN